MNDIRKLPIHKLIITVSIDGPPEIHNKIRGLPNSFERAVNTLNELRKMKGIIVFAGMTLSKDNVLYSSDTIAKLKEKVPGFQINDLHVNIAHSSSHFYGIELSDYPKEKVLSVLKEFRPTRGFNIFHPISWLEKKYQTKIREYFKTGNCPMPCHSMAASCFLDPYGNVYPCSIYNKVIGNVRDERFEDIWLKKERRALASEIRNLNCPQCWTPCEAYQTILANLFRFCAKK
jgi:MoaA/NifB/PqqE/SkfB family radical SAM enzyme